MQIKTLGYRTDLIFPRFDGDITEKDEYVVIKTPSNPNFYWGNFLLFRDAPREGDFERWRALFAEEIGVPPVTNHIAFGWDCPDGETGLVKPFEEAGFSVLHSVVLTAKHEQIHLPPKINREVEIRRLSTDAEWQAAIDIQVETRDPVHEEALHREFKNRQFDRYRRMSEAGLGHWYGAYLGGKMVADLGLFTDGEVGRFQNVETRPEYRRMGICGTLVYEAARYAFEHMGVETLVMVADEFYHAARIYESVGFRPTEKQVGMEIF